MKAASECPVDIGACNRNLALSGRIIALVFRDPQGFADYYTIDFITIDKHRICEHSGYSPMCGCAGDSNGT